MTEYVSANVQRFEGFADCYDSFRPSPPAVLTDVLAQAAGLPLGHRPKLVVDLGCGTGLSTRIWAGKAQQVVGVEPSNDMRGRARKMTPANAGIEYREGFSTRTGLADGSADIVVCSQSLHWMEPQATFAEAARILRTAGVFAAVDCDWPPVIRCEAEAAFAAFVAKIHALEQQHGMSADVRKWSKEEHLQRIQQSGRFRFSREILLHQIEQGNADRLVGLALSQGSVESLLKHGLSEDDIGLTAFRRSAREILGQESMPWYFGYRVRIGVK